MLSEGGSWGRRGWLARGRVEKTVSEGLVMTGRLVVMVMMRMGVSTGGGRLLLLLRVLLLLLRVLLLLLHRLRR